MFQVLVVEDDRELRDLFCTVLEENGYHAIAANDGLQAFDLLESHYIDLIISDVMMPKLDGIRATLKIRETSSIPIIILSAKSEDVDKILGLNIGADDYLTKPFNPLEVVAHVQSALRRFYHLGAGKGPEPAASKLTLGELSLDLYEMKLEKNGVPIELTATEYKILAKLMKQPGRVFTKAQLYEREDGYYSESDDKTMMVHISNIRSKVEDNPSEPKYIKTVRGLGYKIEKV